MVTKVFFSFDWHRDLDRAIVVRNVWANRPEREAAGFWDQRSWERAREQGPEGLQRMIDDALATASATAVLYTRDTAEQPDVQYAISKSYELGHRLLAIAIHEIRDERGSFAESGRSPLSTLSVPDEDGMPVAASLMFPTYDWVNNDGRSQISEWIESAPRRGSAAKGNGTEL